MHRRFITPLATSLVAALWCQGLAPAYAQTLGGGGVTPLGGPIGIGATPGGSAGGVQIAPGAAAVSAPTTPGTPMNTNVRGAGPAVGQGPLQGNTPGGAVAQPGAGLPGTEIGTPNAAPQVASNDFQDFVATSTGRVLPMFGYNLFDAVPSTFAPIENVPVTSD